MDNTANDRITRTPANRPATLDETLVIACAIARNTPEVTAVHVVPGRRPTFDELATMRAAAGPELTASVDGDGVVHLRRPNAAAPAEGAGRFGPWVREARSALARALDGLQGWNGGFSGLGEGVR